jgi:DeoR/GlpR family transcriptional regulator of sugar metabolism
MLKEERHQIILDEIRMHNRVLLSDLAESLSVSVDTIRRDIQFLDQEKKIKKVHGGAVSLSYDTPAIDNKNIFQQDKKAVIALKAVSLLRDNHVVFIGDGTTTQELARFIPHKLKITVFTPSLPVAMQLISHDNVEVIMIGGRLSNNSQVAVGSDTINMIQQIKADMLFLGTGYLHPENGLSEMDYEIVQLKKAMIAAAKRTILVTISEKMNSSQRYKTCDVSAIHTIITELQPTDTLLDPLRKYPLKFM